jgi:hypothetical protein
MLLTGINMPKTLFFHIFLLFDEFSEVPSNNLIYIFIYNTFGGMAHNVLVVYDIFAVAIKETRSVSRNCKNVLE